MHFRYDDTEWGSFDVAHSRFLLEHVSDPLGVVRRWFGPFVRAAASFWRMMTTTFYAFGRSPLGSHPVWQAYIRSYDRLGNDPFVGRRLVGLLHAAGAVPTRNDWIFFGGCAGMPTFPDIVENLRNILVGARMPILSVGPY